MALTFKTFSFKPPFDGDSTGQIWRYLTAAWNRDYCCRNMMNYLVMLRPLHDWFRSITRMHDKAENKKIIITFRNRHPMTYRSCIWTMLPHASSCVLNVSATCAVHPVPLKKTIRTTTKSRLFILSPFWLLIYCSSQILTLI